MHLTYFKILISSPCTMGDNTVELPWVFLAQTSLKK